jgi:hypothetical protein
MLGGVKNIEIMFLEGSARRMFEYVRVVLLFSVNEGIFDY